MHALRHLAAEPRPHACRELVTEENLWRVRVGDYRVVYSIDDAARHCSDHRRPPSQQSVRIQPRSHNVGSSANTTRINAKTGIRLDPWPAEYESSFQIDEFDQDSAGKVETEVEGIAWHAVEAQPRERPEPIHFVYGVRRVEARIILDDESGRIIRGPFGSAGVGTVRVEQSLAAFEEIRVRRCLVVGAGVSPEDNAIADARSLTVGSAELNFELKRTTRPVTFRL